ncbi:cytochrome P450 [Amycolatopsis keratiniphila]|uniref:Cytochrome n=1 Tax=Amycolatopsis keratiniphila subsp. keratiniphila TaxID=227715 RepID=A0A1W2LJS8_9PSEU|nr:cytochrome P450 [Amycolatopsis keratiniphila]OLZ49670.1 cytochrome [Amycolatopsis keratiniphila subsp. nogabecina]ONF63091.1 cytochrome [Amycolatopsis keratiniphila subsp. keratiniphila]SDU22686.1 Cytochrome P450 [Amycolatopsis keratiniphila]
MFALTFRHKAEAIAKPVTRWSIGHAIPRVALRAAARRGDLQGRLSVEASGGADLSGLFDEIRSHGAIATTRVGHVTTRHSACKEVLGSDAFKTVRFVPDNPLLNRLVAWSSSGLIHPIEPPSLLASEPPDHTRYRKLVTRVFTARAVEQLRERTQAITDELLDGLDPTSPVDLIEQYCGLLPVTVISQILGVPPEERDKVLALGGAAAPSLDLGLPWRTFRTVEATLAEFDSWLTVHLEKLRANPGDNLLSKLIAAREDGVGLTERELKATAGLVLAAGFETTVNLLGNGIALLTRHPDELAKLRADPDLWSNAVDEVLRYDPPVLLTGRLAARDTEIGGTPIARGAIVSTVLAGANRDPEIFEDPAAFDVGRSNARDHVSFGAGRHYCLGASLARMEGEIGLRSIFERFPDLRLLSGGRRRETRILRGFETLPAALI